MPTASAAYTQNHTFTVNILLFNQIKFYSKFNWQRKCVHLCLPSMYAKRKLKFRFFFMLVFTCIDQSRSTSKLHFSFYSNVHHITLNGIVFLSLFTSVLSLKKGLLSCLFFFFTYNENAWKEGKQKTHSYFPLICVCVWAL